MPSITDIELAYTLTQILFLVNRVSKRGNVCDPDDVADLAAVMSFCDKSLPSRGPVVASTSLLASALAQWDRAFGASYPVADRALILGATDVIRDLARQLEWYRDVVDIDTDSERIVERLRARRSREGRCDVCEGDHMTEKDIDEQNRAVEKTIERVESRDPIDDQIDDPLRYW